MKTKSIILKALLVIALQVLPFSVNAQQLVNFSCPCGEAVTGFNEVGIAVCKPFSNQQNCPPDDPNVYTYIFTPSTGSVPGSAGRVSKSYIDYSDQTAHPDSPYGGLSPNTLNSDVIRLFEIQHLSNIDNYIFQLTVASYGLAADYIESVEFVEAGLLFDFTLMTIKAHNPNFLSTKDTETITGTYWQWEVTSEDFDDLIVGTPYTVIITLKSP